MKPARTPASLAVALCVVACTCFRTGAAAPPAIDVALESPAPGVYVHYGRQQEPDRANAGDIANFGFVVGERCVAVIDTGSTLAIGRALRAAIARETALPVCAVINTHAHPDHVLGNAAFLDDQPQFIGHARLAEAMRRRGPTYLRALLRDLGDAAAGSALVLPTRAVDSVEKLDVGNRVLTLRAWRTAHTDCDLTVFDERTRTLWAGDLLFVGHVPVVDGSLRGFLAVVGALHDMPADVAIPGHGRAAQWPQALAPEQRYLEDLLRDVRASIKAGRTLGETLESVRAAHDEWQLFDAFHRRNVTAAYAELEWAE